MLVLPLDVTSEKSVAEFFNSVDEKIGTADILINNAGTSDPKRFKDLDEEKLELCSLIQISMVPIGAKNFTAGSIVNILGLRVGFNLSSYATAKAGLIQLTRKIKH